MVCRVVFLCTRLARHVHSRTELQDSPDSHKCARSSWPAAWSFEPQVCEVFLAMSKPEQLPFRDMVEDAFGGVQICVDEQEDLMLTPQQFLRKLTLHLAVFRERQKRGVWLKVPLSGSQFIHPATEVGFVFHHANPAYIMLTRWLPDSPNTLPASPHTQVGVAGMVLNRAGTHVLAIQERISRIPDFWKLPGGLVDGGEQLRHAVVREVLEETGVAVSFVSLAAFRESFLPDKTDYYCICCCVLDDSVYGPGEHMPAPKPQESEIERAKWLPLTEFLSGPWYADTGMLGAHVKAAADVCVAEMEGREKAAPGDDGGGLRFKQVQFSPPPPVGRGGPMQGLYYAPAAASPGAKASKM